MTYRDEWKKDLPGHGALRQLHEQLRSEISDKHARSLPFAEELFDRWERAAQLGFGKDTSIYDASLVLGDVTIGTNTWIGPFTILDGSGGLSIGDHCSISAGVQIYSHDTVKWSLSGGEIPAERAPVRIGDRTYIGPNTVVASGATIGSRCVIGANSLVKGDVPDNAIFVGSPARRKGTVLVENGEIHLRYGEPA